MYTASEKLAIIRLAEDSELSVHRTLDEINVSRSSFYRWYDAYERAGLDGLERKGLAEESGHGTHAWRTLSPADPGQD